MSLASQDGGYFYFKVLDSYRGSRDVLPDNFFWLLANRSQGRQDILKLLHHSCRIPRIE